MLTAPVAARLCGDVSANREQCEEVSAAGLSMIPLSLCLQAHARTFIKPGNSRK